MKPFRFAAANAGAPGALALFSPGVAQESICIDGTETLLPTTSNVQGP